MGPGCTPVRHLQHVSKTWHWPLGGRLRRPVLVVALEVTLCPRSRLAAGVRLAWLAQTASSDSAVLLPRRQVAQQRTPFLCLTPAQSRPTGSSAKAHRCAQGSPGDLKTKLANRGRAFTVRLGPAGSVSGSVSLPVGVSLSVSGSVPPFILLS